MKKIISVITLSVTVSLVACSTLQSPSTPTVALNPIANTNEEAEVRELVENFGKRLQMVSLLSPTAAQDIKDQYSEFVSSTLLEEWTSDVSKAPGRMTSSPWPDRIEITTLTKEGSDRYLIDSLVIEVTSTEAASGDAAAEIPARIVMERSQGRWLITEYAEER